MKWLEGDENREAWYRFKFKPGQLLAGAIRDESGHAQGTVLIEVKEKRETGPQGHLIIGRHVSASDAHYRWWATSGPGKGWSARAAYHLCDGHAHACGYKAWRQTLIHMEKPRLPDHKEAVTSRMPGWMFGRSCYKDIEKHMADLPEKQDNDERSR